MPMGRTTTNDVTVKKQSLQPDSGCVSENNRTANIEQWLCLHITSTVSHNGLFWKSLTHSVNDSQWFWLSISGNSSEK